MRKAWLAPVLIVIAIMLQLTVLNGLRLPGGGVPDLVLVLVAALGIIEGPLAGLISGFAAGLCLDLAPPGSDLIGQYALVFCLAGWAAGQLRGVAGRSALRSAVLAGIVVAAAEALSAAAGLALEPAQVTVAEVRALLPVTIAYDLLLCPFVLYVAVLATARLADGPAAAVLGGVLAARARLHRARDHKRGPLERRLGRPAASSGGGWPGGRHGSQPPARTRARLRPANGVAGSATGLARHPGRPASTPASLRLAAGRRGDGAIGNNVGSGLGPHWQPSRHPGLLAGSSRGFRPRSGGAGGSATWQHGLASGPAAGTPAARGRSRTAISFGAHRGDATLGRALGSAWLPAPGLPAGSGPRPGSGWLAAPARPKTFGPRLRMGASRSAITGRHPAAAVPHMQFRTAPPAVARPPAVPHIQFRTASPGAARRPAAVPRFRRRSSRIRPSATVDGLVSGGVLAQSTFRSARRRSGTPRLRLAVHGRGPGMLGGSGGSALRRSALPVRKQPRFGYGKRSPLSLLTGRRVGGRWLARKRAGSRSGGFLIGRRTGGAR